jgi:hypothetical protein
MVSLVAGCRSLIVGLDPVTDAVMAAGPLSLIVKYGSGLDNVDQDAAERRRIKVVATPGMNAPSVGELTIAMVFALARRIVRITRPWSTGLVAAHGHRAGRATTPGSWVRQHRPEGRWARSLPGHGGACRCIRRHSRVRTRQPGRVLASDVVSITFARRRDAPPHRRCKVGSDAIGRLS